MGSAKILVVSARIELPAGVRELAGVGNNHTSGITKHTTSAVRPGGNKPNK